MNRVELVYAIIEMEVQCDGSEEEEINGWYEKCCLISHIICPSLTAALIK